MLTKKVGTETTYTYDKQRERLQDMTLTGSSSTLMQNKYRYDAVDNILGITNAANPQGLTKLNKAKLGGASTHTYQYDELNRLIHATGKAKSATYDMAMTFGRMSEPLTKVQRVDSSLTAKSYNFAYKYEDENHPTAPTQIGHDHYTYDANGNPTLVTNDSTNTTREMYWDEDNRLMVLSDNGKTSRYTYNAGGERIMKSYGTMEGVYINGAPQGITFHETDNFTLYPAPIISINKNRFTKHYFIGSQRIASRIGTGTFNNVYGINGSYVTAGQQDYAERMNQIQSQKEAYYKELGIAPSVPTEKGAYGDPENTGVGYNSVLTELGNHDVPQGWVQTPKHNTTEGSTPGTPISWNKPSNPDDPQAGYGYIPSDTTTEETFFFHSDHLCSTSYITDDKGNITQYDAYLPYGELLVDEHSSSEEMPYKFNGKEMDEETGLYYYGARYMDPVASMWYGVDPKKEVYESSSSYIFCMENPIRLVDLDGEGWIQTKAGIYYNPKVHSQTDISKHDSNRGFKYLGEKYQNKVKGIFYRADGSIIFNNETDAYNHMWNNANGLYKSAKHRQGKEVGAFILSNGKVLVLPDYNNDSRTSRISDYGYKIGNRKVSKGNEVYSVLAQIHTHQDKTGDPTPSFYSVDGMYDGEISERMRVPVFVLGHDNKVYGILQNSVSNAIFQLPSPFKTVRGFLKSNMKFSIYLKQKMFNIEVQVVKSVNYTSVQ